MERFKLWMCLLLPRWGGGGLSSGAEEKRREEKGGVRTMTANLINQILPRGNLNESRRERENLLEKKRAPPRLRLPPVRESEDFFFFLFSLLREERESEESDDKNFQPLLRTSPLLEIFKRTPQLNILSLYIFFKKGKKCLNLAAHETNDGQELKKSLFKANGSSWVPRESKMACHGCFPLLNWGWWLLFLNFSCFLGRN